MKNELLAKLREFFEMHADPLPVCTELPSENDMCERPKRAYISFGNPYEKESLTYVYARYFENVVAKGYPLESVIKTLKDHGILVSNEEAEQITGSLEECLWEDKKVYAIRDDILDDKINASVTADEALKKIMLLMMIF